MTLQAKMSASDPRLYNPGRDVAHNFQEVMVLVAGRLEDGVWPELHELLVRENITLDDLGAACGAYCQYVASAGTTPNLPMLQSLEQSGFLACKPTAQVAVLAMLGVCYAGIAHAGVREATVGGEGPLLTVAELVGFAEQIRRYQGMSRWQRNLIKLKDRLLRVWAAFRGNK